MDEEIKIKILVVTCEGDKSNDQGVLLLDFVHEDEFAVGRPEFVVDERAGDRAEKEHIEEDEDDEEDDVGLVVLDSHQLVVRIGVVGGGHIGDEDHLVQGKIVTCVGIDGYRVGRVDIVRVQSKCSVANHSKATDHNREENHVDNNVYIS